MVTLREPGDGEVLRDVNFACRIHPAAQSNIGEQQWVTGFQCVKCCRMVELAILNLKKKKEKKKKLLPLHENQSKFPIFPVWMGLNFDDYSGFQPKITHAN